VKWLAEEDERLVSAVKQFGDSGWRNIAEYVLTKDSTQCMQRWKRALRPDLKKGRWTAEEDGRLIRLMAQGFASWSKLAKQMPGRSSKQCRERWSNHLDPCKLPTLLFLPLLLAHQLTLLQLLLASLYITIYNTTKQVLTREPGHQQRMRSSLRPTRRLAIGGHSSQLSCQGAQRTLLRSGGRCLSVPGQPPLLPLQLSL
jgi:Myb-like DNA-binding domain